MGGNAEACASVTAVVVTGSALAEAPAEIKGDLEILLDVIDDSSVGGKSFDDKKFQRTMEPVGTWAEKNCTASRLLECCAAARGVAHQLVGA